METIKRSGRYKIKYDVPFVTKYLISSKKNKKNQFQEKLHHKFYAKMCSVP